MVCDVHVAMAPVSVPAIQAWAKEAGATVYCGQIDGAGPVWFFDISYGGVTRSLKIPAGTDITFQKMDGKVRIIYHLLNPLRTYRLVFVPAHVEEFCTFEEE